MQEEMTRLRMAAAGEDGMLITGGARRDAAWFLPPGYAARPEPGSTVLTADLGGGPLALGVPMAQADLLPEEIRLSAGAAMLLNYYVEITPAGTAEKGGQSHGSDAS